MVVASDWDGPRSIRREELESAARLDALCFPAAVNQVGLEVLIASYVSERLDRIQVITHRGVPVCKMNLYRNRVNLYGSLLRIDNIGSVCTHPDYRGQGLATRLLAHCIRLLTASGARLLLISGTRGLYVRAGCVAAQAFESFTLTPDRSWEEAEGIALRPASEEDAPLCARLYQAEPARYAREVRKFDAHFRQGEGFPKAEDWIVEVNGRPAAYFFTALPWQYEVDHEAGLRAGVREVVEYAGSRVALVGALGLWMTRLALREARLFIPWQDEDMCCLLRRQGWKGEKTRLPDHTMRILDLRGLMADLRPYVRERLPRALRRGLRFEQEGDRCAIVHGAERLERDAAAMTRLVLGAPGEATSDADGFSGALGEIVRALFPLPSFLPGANYC